MNNLLDFVFQSPLMAVAGVHPAILRMTRASPGTTLTLAGGSSVGAATVCPGQMRVPGLPGVRYMQKPGCQDSYVSSRALSIFTCIGGFNPHHNPVRLALLPPIVSILQIKKG